jgi:predicted Rossmann fold flavoprotein
MNQKSSINKKVESYDVAVIGAGPAGMMAALRASQSGARVVVLEKKHSAGLKLLMTGKERCNITNAERDEQTLAGYFGRNGKFLLSALYNFGVEDTIHFFESNGVPVKEERGGRIFPKSDKAMDVQQLLLRLLRKHKVKLRTRCSIKKINFSDGAIKSIQLVGEEINAKNFIIATGGLSYPETGATGDGYAWAKRMGFSIVPPTPALTPIKVDEKWIDELEGLSLKNVAITAVQNNKKQAERFGEALFTRNGLSGPIILDMSKEVGQLLKKGAVELHLDFKPALNFEKLDNRLLRDLQQFSNKEMKNIMSGLLPRKLIPMMLKKAEIDPEKKGHSVSRIERKRLRLLLKEFPLTVSGLTGFNKAVITSGGIALNEVDPTTMRSKKINNLFFAGEILDLDGPTGGFNLQVCWSTGYLAGELAAQN